MGDAAVPLSGREAVETLAGLAALDLPPARVEALAELVAAIERDLAALRGQPPELEPAVVFDARWD